MSNQIAAVVAAPLVHSSDRVRNEFGALLQEIHARLAEVASQHPGQDFKDVYFVDELSSCAVKARLAYRQALSQARRIQDEFDALPTWRNADVYLLKLEIESLARKLMCPTPVRELQALRQRHAEEALAQANQPSQRPCRTRVTYKKQRKVVLPTAMPA